MRLRPLPISTSIALALLLATSACQKQETAAPGDTPATATPASTAEADAKFADVSKRWLDGWLEQQPVSATQTGKHDFDDRIEDLRTRASEDRPAASTSQQSPSCPRRERCSRP